MDLAWDKSLYGSKQSILAFSFRLAFNFEVANQDGGSFECFQNFVLDCSVQFVKIHPVKQEICQASDHVQRANLTIKVLTNHIKQCYLKGMYTYFYSVTLKQKNL